MARRPVRQRRRKTTPSARLEPLHDVVRQLNRTLANSPQPVRRIEARAGDAAVSVEFASPDSTPAFSDASTADLQPGQKVPNQSEVVTVGAFTKRIVRTDPAFASLVSNANAAIVFKDEEHTGADRVMTTRLKTGLDALATLVSQEWPGVKLRVTEAWDEDGEHAPRSLHYEGRAADVTTSPVDGAKLGRLARLAVDAGLEWVFFENSAHVHVSMA